MPKRGEFLQLAVVGAVIGAALPARAQEPTPAGKEGFNVRDYGATGDGQVDDTCSDCDNMAPP
jgi:hypothetical protein